MLAEHPLARDLAARLVHRLSALRLEERQRALKFKLTPQSAPLLYEVSPEASRSAWAAVERLSHLRAVRIEFSPKSTVVEEPMWRSPTLIVLPGAEPILRAVAGLPEPDDFEGALRRALAADVRFTDADHIRLAQLRLQAFSSYEVSGCVERFARLRELAAHDATLYLREASARLFDGHSKLLDDREDLIGALCGGLCPWVATPITFLVSAPKDVFDEIIFIENLTTFERLSAAHTRYSKSLFLYAAGFRASAVRAIGAAGRRYYAQGAFSAAQRALLDQVLSSAGGPPLYFFGDLDYAGMGILAALRTAFPQLTAWRLGYSVLEVALREGRAHRPAAADKSGQWDPGTTGCDYADTVLLPQLRTTGRFVDQEAAAL